MKRLLYVISLILFVLIVPVSFTMGASSGKGQTIGPYTVLEGKVSFVKARVLVIDDQSYPVSMFVRVFYGDEKGPESSMQSVADIGKIDKARIYLLGGKVEKIIVLKNI